MKIVEKNLRVKVKDLKVKDVFRSCGAYYMIVYRDTGESLKVVCLDNGRVEPANSEADVELLEAELHVKFKGIVPPGEELPF